MANYGIGQRTYVAVLDMPAVDGFASFDRKYEGIAKYPAVTRDISMVVPRTVLVGQIEKILAQRGGKILESYQLFDATRYLIFTRAHRSRKAISPSLIP